MFIITSEQRVGSKWLHYLFADLLHKGVSPELDGKKLKDNVAQAEMYMENGLLPKFFSATPQQLRNYFPTTKILGVVRDPRDRYTSLSFHKRYHKRHFFIEQECNSDIDSVRHTVLENEVDAIDSTRILEYMTENNSTHSTEFSIPEIDNYGWTTYEWLKEDTIKEIQRILKLFKIDIVNPWIFHTVDKHSFKNKTGREPGEEDRKNTWTRKGVVGDWTKWFNTEMIDTTRKLTDEYYSRIRKELNIGDIFMRLQGT